MSMSSSAKVETHLIFLTDKAPRQASRAWDEASRLDWRRTVDVGFDIKGYSPLGDGGVLANEMTCPPNF